MTKLSLEKESHTYKWGGLIVPSVSELIEPYVKYCFNDRNAMQKGIDLHALFEYYDTGELDTAKLSDYFLNTAPEYESYYCHYLDFLDNNTLGIDYENWQIERSLYSRLGFCGTPDRYDNKLILDYKTGLFYKHYRIQLHGYYQLLLDQDGIKRDMWCIMFTEKGWKPKRIKFSIDDLNRFKNGLNIWKYKNGG